jgi:GNAT superfamily N-acetyltransferase
MIDGVDSNRTGVTLGTHASGEARDALDPDPVRTVVPGSLCQWRGEELETAWGLEFRSGYWDDRRAKEQFKQFLISIHGLDLGLWEEQGYWDDEHYTAFSLFDGDRVVATTNLFSMEMMVDGVRRRLGQFSGVGTAPEYRGRGLNRWLTEQALQLAAPDHDGFFLFADEDAIPFYAKCGFVQVEETVATLRVTPPARSPGLRKLDPGDDGDLSLLYRLARERSPVSDLLGASNPRLLMFHCLYTLRDCLYYVPDLDTAVFFEVADGVLTLFDVVGRSVPSFAELHPYIAGTRHHEVRFFFMPDRLGVEPISWTVLEDNHLHVLPPLPLPGPRRLFPFVSRA